MSVEPAYLINDDIRGSATELIRLLREYFSQGKIGGQRIAISFSGGLDSTLLAKICSEASETCGIVAGTPSSIDIKNARTSARQLDMELREITINEDDVVNGARDICRITGSTDPLTISFELPTFFALRSAKERIVVTGQGADELFGGYAKYEKLSPDEFSEMRAVDLNRVLGPIERIEERIASSLQKELLKPFLSNRVISFAMALPVDFVFPSAGRKLIIRHALVQLGLRETATFDKKAAQYGSGVASLLRKAAAKRDQSAGEFIADLADKGD